MFFGLIEKINQPIRKFFLKVSRIIGICVQVELPPGFRYNIIQVMSKKKEKLEEIVNGVLEDREEELYLLRWEKRGKEWVLGVLVDKESPVTSSDCAEVSERISVDLDEAGLIDRQYELRVSSPGLERPLIEARHFQDAVDSLVEIKTYGPINGTKEFTGILNNYDPNEEKIEVQWEGEPLNISLSQVAKANTKLTEEDLN